MKYLLGLVLTVVAMASTAKDDWHIGTWIIDVEKTKEHSQHLTGEEKKLAERAQKAATKGIYEVKEEYLKLFALQQGVASPKFQYKVEETDRNTVILKAKKRTRESTIA